MLTHGVRHTKESDRAWSRWWTTGLLLCGLVMLFSRCKLPTSPCDAKCQSDMFLCFHGLRSCDEVCSLSSQQSVTCKAPPVEEGADSPTVTLLASDCGACQSALLVWQQGRDCNAGQVRCAKKTTNTGLDGYLFQKCVEIQGRWTWSSGRLCDEQDRFPCVRVDGSMQCLGCGVDQDCVKGERCNQKTLKCEQCVGASDCPGYLPYCSKERRCAACTKDSHCQPTFSGHYCVRGSCRCEQDDDCQAAGYLTCSSTTRLCQPCQSDNDCPAEIFGVSGCSDGRCLIPCQKDRDCSFLNNGICDRNRCLPGCLTDRDCKALHLKYCSNRRCHQCLKHIDCPIQSPFCHPKLLKCTECLSNEDCPPRKPLCNQSFFSCSKK